MMTNNKIRSEHSITKFNYFTINDEEGDTVFNMYVNQTEDNSEVLQMQVITCNELEWYEELSNTEATDMRDFMNKAYPLTLKEVFKVTLTTLKSIVHSKGI